MISSDVLGYPVRKHFYRIHLENAWKAAFGVLDIGDFETFLKESADRTYADALALIKKMGIGEATETGKIAALKEYEQRGGIEQYRNVADDLRRDGKEYEAGAIESLIADLIKAQAQRKPERKSPDKRKPKAKPLPVVPDIVPAQQPKPMKDIAALCKQSPLDRKTIEQIIAAVEVKDTEAAKKIIQECKTLDEFDKFEIIELLAAKAMGITEPAKEYVHKEPPKPKTTVSTGRVRRKEEEEKKVDKKILPFKAVEYEYHDINLQNAKLFFHDYQKYVPEMLQVGLQKWLEMHRTVFKFPLTSHNIFSLASAIEFSIVIPEQKSVRNTVAVQFISKHASDILVRGMQKASDSFAWGQVYSYYKDTLKKDMPPIENFKRDVLDAAKNIRYSFE